jgi:hypothetical protein
MLGMLCVPGSQYLSAGNLGPLCSARGGFVGSGIVRRTNQDVFRGFPRISRCRVIHRFTLPLLGALFSVPCGSVGHFIDMPGMLCVPGSRYLGAGNLARMVILWALGSSDVPTMTYSVDFLASHCARLSTDLWILKSIVYEDRSW